MNGQRQKYRSYLLAAALAMIMVTFVAPEVHEGNAMAPTLENGDVILIKKKKFSQKRGMPEPGALVVLTKHAFGKDFEEDNPVRRVARVEGTEVFLYRDNLKGAAGEKKTFDDGTGKIDSRPDPDPGETGKAGKTPADPPGETVSVDSSKLKGTVLFRLWPIDKIKGVK